MLFPMLMGGQRRMYKTELASDKKQLVIRSCLTMSQWPILQIIILQFISFPILVLQVDLVRLKTVFLLLSGLLYPAFLINLADKILRPHVCQGNIEFGFQTVKNSILFVQKCMELIPFVQQSQLVTLPSNKWTQSYCSSFKS